MGQYQKWLLAQDISQHLKAEIETLETELLYLKDRVAILEQAVPDGENVVLLALQSYLCPSEIEEDLAGDELPVEVGTNERTPGGLDESLWTGLPRAEMPLARPPFSFADLSSPDLTEEDELTSVEQRKQTDPHLTSIVAQSEHAGAGRSESEEQRVDKETLRLNENIQRWFDRWHRQIRGIARTEEVSDER